MKYIWLPLSFAGVLTFIFSFIFLLSFSKTEKKHD
jgi:hypothetical protein